MSVLTPFPNRSADNQNYGRDNASALRNEINRVMNTAYESIQGMAPFGQPQSYRNPILTLQSEINRIVSLLIQSNLGTQGVSFGPGQPYNPVSFGAAPVAFGTGVQQVPFGGAVFNSGQNNLGATLLAEINRVFNTVLQDSSPWQQSSWPQSSFPQISGSYGNFGVNPVAYLQNEINRVFNLYLQDQNGFTESGFGFTPRVNLGETTDSIEIEVELPGFTEADVDLSVNGNVVTIKGWRRRNTNENIKDFHILERGYGTFSRSLTLPFEADPSLVRASFTGGLLTIEITKPESVRESTQRIEIAKAS